MEVCPLSRGVILPCGAMPIQSITAWHSLAPRSFTRTFNNIPCGLPATRAKIRAYHVPRMGYAWVRFCLFADDHKCPCIPIGKRDNRSCAFWLKPGSAFGLFLITTFISSLLMLTMPRSLAPYPPRRWQKASSTHRVDTALASRLHCPGGFTPSRYQLRMRR